MKNRVDNFVVLMTLISAFWSLIISIITFCINVRMFELETKEKILLSVSTKEIGPLDFIYTDAGEKKLMYTLKVTISFINDSKLPIYLEEGHIKKYYLIDIEDDINDNDNEEMQGIYELGEVGSETELDAPIYLEPQGTTQVDCIFHVYTPEIVSQYVLEEFADVDELNIYDIQNYLVAEKFVSLWGDNINVDTKDGKEIFEYERRPYFVYFYSSRGNCFTTEYFIKSYVSDQLIKDMNLVITQEEGWITKALDFIIEHYKMIPFWLIMIIISIFMIYKIMKNQKNKL